MATATKAWWLKRGEETCPACLQAYHWDEELRCGDCDEPLCPRCAIRIRVEGIVRCPRCQAGVSPRPGEGARR